MPRIDFNHPEIDKWIEAGNSGSETLDLCKSCAEYNNAADLNCVARMGNRGGNGDPIPDEAEIEILGQDLLDWLEDEDYKCDECNVLLTEKNY
jgi:hypothetical protein